MNTSVTTAQRSKQQPDGLNILRTFRHVVTRIAGRIRGIDETRTTYRALRDLDDRLLRDIGLTRADVAELRTFHSNRH